MRFRGTGGYIRAAGGNIGGSMTNPDIPASGIPEVIWPALPPPALSGMFALLQQFEHSQWWPAEMVQRHQLRQLESLAGHALRTVPFYRDRLDCLDGTGPGELTMEQWRQVPVMDRTDIQDAEQELYSRALPRDHLPLGEISTSGSTGSPVTVKTTRLTGLFFNTVQMRYHMWHGRNLSGKTCSIKVIQGKAPTRPGNWVPGYRSGPLVLFDITRPVSEQFDWLMREAPDYLLTYPNNLRALIELSENTGKKIPGLRQVATMSEVLDPDLREECQSAWRVPLSDAYSAQETGPLALQCPDHPTYHVQSENVCMEILDADGAPCGPGGVGRVVVTDLSNFASPLIRYAIGDYAEVGAPCPCGRGLPVLNRVMGRSRNMLRLPSGDQLWPKFGFPRFPQVAPVRQSQVVQKTLDTLEVRLVTARPLVADEEKRLREMICEAVGFPFNVVFSYPDEIPRSASGKYEDFQSEVAV